MSLTWKNVIPLHFFILLRSSTASGFLTLSSVASHLALLAGRTCRLHLLRTAISHRVGCTASGKVETVAAALPAHRQGRQPEFSRESQRVAQHAGGKKQRSTFFTQPPVLSLEKHKWGKELSRSVRRRFGHISCVRRGCLKALLNSVHIFIEVSFFKVSVSSFNGSVCSHLFQSFKFHSQP